jgi:hypothetical protein
MTMALSYASNDSEMPPGESSRAKRSGDSTMIVRTPFPSADRDPESRNGPMHALSHPTFMWGCPRECAGQEIVDCKRATVGSDKAAPDGELHAPDPRFAPISHHSASTRGRGGHSESNHQPRLILPSTR